MSVCVCVYVCVYIHASFGCNRLRERYRKRGNTHTHARTHPHPHTRVHTRSERTMDDDLDLYYGTHEEGHPTEDGAAAGDEKDIQAYQQERQQEEDVEDEEEEEDDACDLYDDIKIQLSETAAAEDPLAVFADSSQKAHSSNNGTHESGEG